MFLGGNLNAIIAAAVGGALSAITLVSGVNAYTGGDADPVSSQDLYSYSDE